MIGRVTCALALAGLLGCSGGAPPRTSTTYESKELGFAFDLPPQWRMFGDEAKSEGGSLVNWQVKSLEGADPTWLEALPGSVVPDEGRLWHVLAVLLAPPVTVHAATTYAGAALSPTALKLSASQVAALPLPARSEPWDEAANLLSLGQEANLLRSAELMCAAYDVPPGPVLDWWRERVAQEEGA